MLRLLSNVTYPGHARLATDRRLLEGDNWNCGCDGANRDEHLTLEPRHPPLGTRQNYTKVSDQFWPVRDTRRAELNDRNRGVAAIEARRTGIDGRAAGHLHPSVGRPHPDPVCLPTH